MSAEQFSEAVLTKAKAVPTEDIEPQNEEGTVWRVRSGRTGRMHTVQFIDDEHRSWVTCSCQHGRSNGGQAGCYHAASAYLARHDETDTEGDHGD